MTKKTNTEISEESLLSLDYSFIYLTPEHFYTVGRIFGLKPAKVETARVLHIECGSGPSSINFASLYPKSKVLGIDGSKSKIEKATKTAKDLGLGNVEFKNISIADIDKPLGEFDYIICNGVFSWVSRQLQDKLLGIIKKSLSPHGIAHVNYNTLPGWNIVNTFRDMMRYHASIFEKKEEKLAQAGAFINFMLESASETDSPYAKFLQDEARILQATDAGYVWREYLAEGNSQFYFSDFMYLAHNAGLNYLGDTHVQSMYTGNLPAKAFEALKEVKDIVRSEQYMDFITNRRFRNTLLCHNNVEINRAVDEKIVDEMWMSMRVTAQTPVEKVDFSDNITNLLFTIHPHNIECGTTSSMMKAILYAFSEAPSKFWSMPEIKKFVVSKCPELSSKEAETVLKQNLLQMIFKGMLNVRAEKPKIVTSISDSPEIGKFALYQAGNDSPSICSLLGDSINVNVIQKLVMQKLDGKHKVGQIVDSICKDYVETGKFELNYEGKIVTDKAAQKQLVSEMVNNVLQFCLACAFLVK